MPLNRPVGHAAIRQRSRCSSSLQRHRQQSTGGSTTRVRCRRKGHALPLTCAARCSGLIGELAKKTIWPKYNDTLALDCYSRHRQHPEPRHIGLLCTASLTCAGISAFSTAGPGLAGALRGRRTTSRAVVSRGTRTGARLHRQSWRAAVAPIVARQGVCHAGDRAIRP